MPFAQKDQIFDLMTFGKRKKGIKSDARTNLTPCPHLRCGHGAKGVTFVTNRRFVRACIQIYDLIPFVTNRRFVRQVRTTKGVPCFAYKSTICKYEHPKMTPLNARA